MFRSSYKEVHVSLADLNDHPPVFDKEEYEIRVPESALVNTPLTRLKVRAASLGISIPDPGPRVEKIPDPRIRIRIKELSIFNTKNYTWLQCCGSGIRDPVPF
jgi:hypothetical protein